MITLHLLEYLKEEGFGTAIDTDLHFEVLPLDKDGIAIFSRGGEMATGRNSATQRFDIYCKDQSNVMGMYKLENVMRHFSDLAYEMCTLPAVPGVSEIEYKNVRITAIDNIENIGLTDNDRIIYRLAAQVTYIRQ